MTGKEICQHPRKNLGEKTKLHLFFVLSIIFLFTGLIGHEPWRPLESTSISIILDIIQNNQVILPMAASENLITHPPYILCCSSIW